MAARDTEKIRLSAVHFPVRVLGPGRRTGVWLQGCGRRCLNCISAHAWDPAAGYEMSVAELLLGIEEYMKLGSEGLTVSGGEPFDQPEALGLLLEGCRSLGIDDILVYSGKYFEELSAEHPGLLSNIDALVDGPFVYGEETDFIWKGSSGQRMIVLSKTEEVVRRYEEYRNVRAEKRELQVEVKDAGVFVFGIPKQKDTEALLDVAF